MIALLVEQFLIPLFLVDKIDNLSQFIKHSIVRFLTIYGINLILSFSCKKYFISNKSYLDYKHRHSSFHISYIIWSLFSLKYVFYNIEINNLMLIPMIKKLGVISYTISEYLYIQNYFTDKKSDLA